MSCSTTSAAAANVDLVSHGFSWKLKDKGKSRLVRKINIRYWKTGFSIKYKSARKCRTRVPHACRGPSRIWMMIQASMKQVWYTRSSARSIWGKWIDMMFVGLKLDTVRVLHEGTSQKQSIQDPHQEYIEALLSAEKPFNSALRVGSRGRKGCRT